MQILYLHQHFAARDGSAGTRSYEFARLLKQMGHELVIICGVDERSGLVPQAARLVTELDVEGLRVHQLNVSYSQKMSYLRRLVSFVWFVILASWVAFKQRDADVIFASSTPLTIAIPAMIASRLNKRPFVFEVRDLWPDVPIGLGLLRNRFLIILARSLEYLAYRSASRVVACSPGAREKILEKGVHPDKVCVIPNGCDNELFDVDPEVGLAFRARHPHLSNRALVVYPGAFGRVNGLDYIVRLAERTRLLNDRVAFLLIGDGSEKEKVCALAHDLGLLNETVWVMDALPRHKIPEVLSAADIVTSTVIPNEVLWHNSANKFFDALAAGRPVAINHEGWLAQLLRTSGAGIVLDVHDVEKAADQLVHALQDRDWLDEAGSAAKMLSKEQYSRDKLAQSLEDVLLSSIRNSESTSDRSRRDIAKRVFDLAIAIPGLILLAPLLALIAIAVRLKLGSPVWFRQQRPGQGGQPFTLFKFRSMVCVRGANGELLSDGERLTRFGKFLRSTSLDELPELINVLRGEMSIVGPRPLLMEYLDRYTPDQAKRHEVKPGITGWAQINGRNAITWKERFALDLWYVRNRSLSLDLWIIASTVWKVLRREGISQTQHATMPEFLGHE